MPDIIKILIANPSLLDIENIPGLKLTKFLNENHLEIDVRKYNGYPPNKDISYFDVLQAITHICNTYKINPFDCELRSVVYSLKINPEMPPARITGIAAFHKQKPFTINRRGERICDYQQYRFKMAECGNELRFAKDAKRMAHLKNHDISVLVDLLIPKKLYRLGQDLLKSYDETLMLEQIPVTSLNKNEKKLLETVKNLEHESAPSSMTSRQRRKLIELSNRHSPKRINMSIKRLIQEKVVILLKMDMQMVKQLADFLWQYRVYEELLDESKYFRRGEELRRRLIADLTSEGDNFSITNYMLGLQRDEDEFDGFDQIIAFDTIYGVDHRESITRWMIKPDKTIYENGYLVKCFRV